MGCSTVGISKAKQDLLFPELKARVESKGELAAGHVSCDWLGARLQRLSRKHRGWVTRESADDTVRARDYLEPTHIARYEVGNVVEYERDAAGAVHAIDEGLGVKWEIRRQAMAYGSWKDDLAHQAGRWQTRVESTQSGTVKVTAVDRLRSPLSPSHPSQ